MENMLTTARRTACAVFIIIAAAALPERAAAQYYDTGQTPARQRWMQVKTDSLRMIFPREFEAGARRTLFYMESARPYVGYGLTYAPLRTPVIFKTENFYSNGLGMLTPRRIEMVSIPSADTYAEPWLKQLAIHEYRHMAQYSSMNRNTVRALSWVLGEQVSLVATGLLPFWFIEGDAVMAETQMSDFGRAMQPSFTMHYRALGREILEKGNPDKWFAGSYKDYVPNHYELGYQLVEYSQHKYGKYIWDDIISYSSKYPFLIFTTQLGLGKYYDTSSKKLFMEAFGRLNDHWDSLPQTGDSARAMVEEPDSYTTYSHPLFVDENTVVALRNDLHKTSRFVLIDVPTGHETHLAYTGPVSSRPEYKNGTLWWTEYRQSALWEQKTDSRVFRMNIAEGVARRFGDWNQALYPTPTENDGIAYVKYHYDGRYSIEWAGGSLSFASDTSLHGLAFDEVTGMLCFIALSDGGMWIGAVDRDGENASAKMLSNPSRVTVSDLRAGGGKLYFGSIAAGKDEAHMLNLADGREYRVTESRYGSFSPAPSANGKDIVMTVYGRHGYRPAIQDTGQAFGEVAPAYLPANVVNPETVKWDVPKMNEMVFTADDLSDSEEKNPARRFRQVPHMFRVHSWAPVYYEPENIINSTEFNIHAGATLVSQSLLGNAVSSLGYGYTSEGNSLVRGSLSYLGSAPKFQLTATWKDSDQRVSRPEGVPAPSGLKDYLMVTANVYQPILLSGGRNVIWLTPSIQYLHRNSLLWDQATSKYINGEGYLAGVVSYTHSVRQAQLDLQPKWGYALKLTVLGRPGNDRFTTVWSLYGRAYLPGIVRHHGLTLSASYMEAVKTNRFGYPVYDVLPRGYTSDDFSFLPLKYVGLSATYRLPLIYPDWGASGVFFLKRIWMSLGADYARCLYGDQSPYTPFSDWSTEIWSWGGTLNFDMSLFRLPSEGTCTLAVSCFVNAKGEPFVSAGFTVPL